MTIYKPTEQDLQPLIDQAKRDQITEQWVEKYLSNLKTLLLRNPLRYRAHGPYWWPLKKAYTDRGDFSFGESIDLEWSEAMDYGKPELNIMAAHIYEEMRTAKNMIDDPFHTMETEDSGDSVEYASNDPDMEIMALG